MIFNSFLFVFLFLPITFAGCLLAPARLREWLVLLASLIFYGFAGVEHVVVLFGCMAWVWAFTAGPDAPGSRWRLVAGLIGPLVTLFYYKYLGFVVREMLPPVLTGGWRPDVADKLLPAGISFFTFHLLAFSFDRYHSVVPRQPPLAHFMLYIAFFPHLVAGPILRYGEVESGLNGLARFRPSEEDLRKAISYFCCGLVGKVVLADGVAAFVRPLAQAADALTPLQAAYALLGYSFQIYFDFWGYSLMAMGLAFLFGFTFPKNFDRPYHAVNPRDFWRRWHMSLSRWFRDYLYLPLGGNRAYVRNTLIVFTVCGLWHGAAWQFVVWGGYHGVLIVAYHLSQRWWDRVPRLAQQGVTFALVSLGWVLFQFDFATAASFMGSLLGAAPTLRAPALGGDAWAMLGLTAAVCFLVDVERLLQVRGGGRWVQWGHSCGYAAALVAALLLLDRSDSFIYFRF